MIESIVEEKLVSFKTLEQKVFAYVCELGRVITWKVSYSRKVYQTKLPDGRKAHVYLPDEANQRFQFLR